MIWRPHQTISEALHARCIAKAREIEADCLTGRNGTHRASHGIEHNLQRLIDGKVGECVAAQALDLDPDTALHWVGPDPGWDMIWHGLKIDTKATGPDRHYLLWPINKNPLYAGAPFDLLALVKVEERAGEVIGWRSKRGFLADRADVHPLTPGTWCVHENLLLSFGPLAEFWP